MIDEAGGTKTLPRIANLRSELAQIRGQLYDIGATHPDWAENIQTAGEGITLVISHLYSIMQDMEHRRD